MLYINDLFYGDNTRDLLSRQWSPSTGLYPTDTTDGLVFIAQDNGTVLGEAYVIGDTVYYAGGDWLRFGKVSILPGADIEVIQSPNGTFTINSIASQPNFVAGDNLTVDENTPGEFTLSSKTGLLQWEPSANLIDVNVKFTNDTYSASLTATVNAQNAYTLEEIGRTYEVIAPINISEEKGVYFKLPFISPMGYTEITPSAYVAIRFTDASNNWIEYRFKYDVEFGTFINGANNATIVDSLLNTTIITSGITNNAVDTFCVSLIESSGALLANVKNMVTDEVYSFATTFTVGDTLYISYSLKYSLQTPDIVTVELDQLYTPRTVSDFTMPVFGDLVDISSYPTNRANNSYEILGLSSELLSTAGMINNGDIVTFNSSGDILTPLSLIDNGVDLSVDNYVTGELSLDLSLGQSQLVMTDDPTFNSPTYFFGVSKQFQGDTFVDYRLLDAVNGSGTYTYIENATGDGAWFAGVKGAHMTAGETSGAAIINMQADAVNLSTGTALVLGTDGTIGYEAVTFQQLDALQSQVDDIPIITVPASTEIFKGDGSGGIVAATNGIDYAPSTYLQAGNILKGTVGGDFSAAVAGTDFVAPNAAIAGGTYTKITYDSKGLVTTGTTASTADIAVSIDKNYVTDAQLVVIGNTSGVNTGDDIVYSGTWAGKPAASSYTGKSIRTTDVNNLEFVSNGTDWLVHNGRGLLYKNAKYLGLPHTATIGTGMTDNITFGSNFHPIVTTQALWLYLDCPTSDPVVTAGMYYVTFSSQSVGTIYTNGPSSAAFNFISGGTMTGTSTGTAIVVDSFTIPGGMFKNWSQIEMFIRTRCSSSTNNKILSVSMIQTPNTSKMTTITYSGGSVVGEAVKYDFIAMDNNVRVGVGSAHTGLGTFTNIPASSSVLDLTLDITVRLTLEKATETEFHLIEMARAEIIQ